MARTPRPWFVLRCLLLFSIVVPESVFAATLKSETVQAWDSYIQSVRSRVQVRPTRRQSSADKIEMVGSDKPVVNLIALTPVPGGMVHDWAGKVFIPDATVNAVMSTMRDYRHYQYFFHPGVITASPLACSESKDHFDVIFTGKSLGADSALEGEYSSTYVPVDDTHWYSISETTHLWEIEHFGAAEQHILPEGEGKGFIWKLFTITTFEQLEGGVGIEVEAIALSRDIPGSLRWIAMPIVKRVSKASLVTTLQQTSEAVRSRDTNLTVAGGGRSAQKMDGRPKVVNRSYR